MTKKRRIHDVITLAVTAQLNLEMNESQFGIYKKTCLVERKEANRYGFSVTHLHYQPRDDGLMA